MNNKLSEEKIKNINLEIEPGELRKYDFEKI